MPESRVTGSPGFGLVVPVSRNAVTAVRLLQEHEDEESPLNLNIWLHGNACTTEEFPFVKLLLVAESKLIIRFCKSEEKTACVRIGGFGWVLELYIVKDWFREWYASTPMVYALRMKHPGVVPLIKKLATKEYESGVKNALEGATVTSENKGDPGHATFSRRTLS